MNHQLYAFLALDLARQRAEEANRHRLASMFDEDAESASSGIRRSLAQVLAAISRGSASAVRRLDSCIADDLGRTLAPSE